MEREKKSVAAKGLLLHRHDLSSHKDLTSVALKSDNSFTAELELSILLWV